MMFSGATSSRSTRLMNPSLRLACSLKTQQSLSVRTFCQMQRLNMLALQQNRAYRMPLLQSKQTLINTPTRSFFGRKKGGEPKADEQEKKSEAAAEAEADKKPAAEGEAEGAAAAEESKDADVADKKEESSSSSSASESEEEGGLSAADVKRIKKLFNEQEAEIKGLEKRIKELEDAGVRKDKET